MSGESTDNDSRGVSSKIATKTTPFELTFGPNGVNVGLDIYFNEVAEPPIELGENPDAVKEGAYTRSRQEGKAQINKLVQEGFWAREQAEDYAKGYGSAMNTYDVCERNSLVGHILEDEPDVGFEYPEEAWDELHIDELAFPKKQWEEGYEESCRQFLKNVRETLQVPDNVEISYESYDTLHKITFTKYIDNESYRFNLNIQGDHALSFISWQRVTDLLVGFEDELDSDTTFRNIFTMSPRTDIQVPPAVRQQLLKEKENLRRARARQVEREGQYHPEKLSGWQTTDPRAHSSDSFRYIVHAVADEATRLQLAVARLQMVQEGEEMEDVQRGSAFEDPETFLNRKWISTSVIDQVHRATWSTTGVILKVPEGNILAAKNSDMGSIPNERILSLHGRPDDAASLLRQTHPTVYNEAIVTGTNTDTGEKTEFAGVFIILDPRTGKPIDETMAMTAKGFANLRKIPVVEIEAPVQMALK